jgi:hypothetical protein
MGGGGAGPRLGGGGRGRRRMLRGEPGRARGGSDARVMRACGGGYGGGGALVATAAVHV